MGIILRLFFALILLQVSLAEAESLTEVNLGILLPLSGGAADQGRWSRRGFELAAAEISKKTDLSINLIFEDTRGDPRAAVSIYKNLQARKQIPVIFTWGSGVAMALLPLVNKDRVIQMGVATGTPDYRRKGDFNFRNFHSLVDEGRYIARVVREELKAKRIAVLQINNDYGVSSAEEFKKNFIETGGEIVFEETFEPRENDFRTYLLRIKNKKPELVFLATYPAEGALVLKQARELGIHARFLASGAILGGDNFFSLTGDAAEGLLVVGPRQNEGLALISFQDKYRMLHGEDMPVFDWYSTRAYDALMLVARSIERCGNSDTKCLKEELFKVKDYPGLSGNLSFDECGDISSEFRLLLVKNKKFEFFK